MKRLLNQKHWKVKAKRKKGITTETLDCTAHNEWCFQQDAILLSGSEAVLLNNEMASASWPEQITGIENKRWHVEHKACNAERAAETLELYWRSKE